MKKNIIALVALIAALSLTACGNSGKTNADTTEAMSQNVTSEEGQTVADVKFTEVSGTVKAVKTTVLCTAPESGAGYEGFLMKGSEAELKGTDESGEWLLIEYNGKTYYVLAKYMEHPATDPDETTGSDNTNPGIEPEQQAGTKIEETSENKNNVSDNTGLSNNGTSGEKNNTLNSTDSSNNNTSNKPAGETKQTQPAGNKNTGSNTPAATKAAVWHDPVYSTTQVWVVDKAAWTEEVKTPRQVPIYQDIEYYECTCGYIINTSSESEWISHIDSHLDKEEKCASRVITKKELVGYKTEYDISYISHPEEGHYETQTVLVKDGYWE